MKLLKKIFKIIIFEIYFNLYCLIFIFLLSKIKLDRMDNSFNKDLTEDKN